MFVNVLKNRLLLSMAAALVFFGMVTLAYQVFAARPSPADLDEGNAADLDNKRQQLRDARADLETSQAAKQEAFRRRDCMVAANKKSTLTVFASDEIREAELACERCAKVVAARRAACDLALLELRASSNAMETQRQKVTLAQAELDAAIAAKEEAFYRWDRMVEPQRSFRFANSVDNGRSFEEAKTACDRCIQEENKRREALYQAYAELNAFGSQVK